MCRVTGWPRRAAHCSLSARAAVQHVERACRAPAPDRPHGRPARRTPPGRHRPRTSPRSRRSARWPAPSVSNSAFWKARTSSGSSRSASAVKPERSAKSTVTWRRSASRWVASFVVVRGASAVPHRTQNAKSASHEDPHAGHAKACRRPQRGQKENSPNNSKPQPMHAIVVDRWAAPGGHLIGLGSIQAETGRLPCFGMSAYPPLNGSRFWPSWPTLLWSGWPRAAPGGPGR